MNSTTIPPFLYDNGTIIALILNEKVKVAIGYGVIDYLENNNTIFGDELKIILIYLKKVPQQGNKILDLLYEIGGKKTVQLINTLTTPMMLTLIIHIDINNFSKVINEYGMYEVIHTINEFNHYNISKEGKNHVLIQSINNGKLPGFFEGIINIYRRTKRLVENTLNN